MWEILQGKLWQGHILDGYQKADLIIDLTVIADLPREFKMHIQYPILDHAELPDMAVMLRIADFTAHQIALRYTVISHCFAGKNRSGLMNGLILHAYGYGDGLAIVALILKQRPGALTNDTFRNYLLGLGKP